MKNEVKKEYTTNLALAYEISEPALYQVLLHNDDFTPMEFVVVILEKYFFMDRRKATEAMLEAHIKGKAACGVYSREVAETKISQVIDYGRLHEYPLVFSMEAV